MRRKTKAILSILLVMFISFVAGVLGYLKAKSSKTLEGFEKGTAEDLQYINRVIDKVREDSSLIGLYTSDTTEPSTVLFYNSNGEVVVQNEGGVSFYTNEGNFWNGIEYITQTDPLTNVQSILNILTNDLLKGDIQKSVSQISIENGYGEFDKEVTEYIITLEDYDSIVELSANDYLLASELQDELIVCLTVNISDDLGLGIAYQVLKENSLVTFWKFDGYQSMLEWELPQGLYTEEINEDFNNAYDDLCYNMSMLVLENVVIQLGVVETGSPIFTDLDYNTLTEEDKLSYFNEFIELIEEQGYTLSIDLEQDYSLIDYATSLIYTSFPNKSLYEVIAFTTICNDWLISNAVVQNYAVE